MTKKQLRNVGLGLMAGPVLLLLVKSMAWMLDLELSEGWKDLLLAFGDCFIVGSTGSTYD